MEYIPIVSH